MPKIIPANVIRRALDATPAQAFVTREDLIAFGTALIDLLAANGTSPSRECYVTLSDLCRDYKTGRVQMSRLLTTHLVRKLALPHGGVRYHKEDAQQFLSAHFSVHNSAPATI